MPSSGVLREYHRLVLLAVVRGEVSLAESFEYRLAGRRRHCTEGVYLLESFGYVELHRDGTVTATGAGCLYLDKHLAPPVPVNA